MQHSDDIVSGRGGKRNKEFRSAKNLGSGANYIEDEQSYQAEDKVKFYKRQEQSTRDQAKIKYNYKDFLSQFQNLTEQCIFYVQTLATGE